VVSSFENDLQRGASLPLSLGSCSHLQRIPGRDPALHIVDPAFAAQTMKFGQRARFRSRARRCSCIRFGGPFAGVDELRCHPRIVYIYA
jgi:hypothetical protein